jgi:adenylate cyclase
VQHEVRGTLNDAWSVQEAVRSIFVREAIKPTDEVKREFIFLALLRSHPTLSWIALGFPDGAFFGALRAADDEIEMVEVKRNPETGIRQQRVDTYTPEPGDLFFRGRKGNRSVPRRHSQGRNRVLCAVAPMPNIAVGPLPASLRLRLSATAII